MDGGPCISLGAGPSLCSAMATELQGIPDTPETCKLQSRRSDGQTLTDEGLDGITDTGPISAQAAQPNDSIVRWRFSQNRRRRTLRRRRRWAWREGQCDPRARARGTILCVEIPIRFEIKIRLRRGAWNDDSKLRPNSHRARFKRSLGCVKKLGCR